MHLRSNRFSHFPRPRNEKKKTLGTVSSECHLNFTDTTDTFNQFPNKQGSKANVRMPCLLVFIVTHLYKWKNQRGRTESSVWRALRRETQSNRESMRSLWFFHLYILSSATKALSTLCQGRLYPHIYSSSSIHLFPIISIKRKLLL